MDCQEFVRKRKSSSSSSQSEDDSIVGNDEPTRVKVVQKNDGGQANQRENNTRGVVIFFNTEETKEPTSHNHDIRSESQKSSGLSSQSRPSIYDEAQRGDIYWSQNEERHAYQNRPFRNNQINIPYFDSQKYHHQNYRNNYPRQNQAYPNNYSRENTYYQNQRGQRRFHYNNDRLENDHYHQRERNYEREGRYERRDQRQNFRNYNNYQNQTQPDQKQNYESPNYQRNNDREYYNDRQQEKQQIQHHKQQQKKVSKTSNLQQKVQKSLKKSSTIEKKSSDNKITSQKYDIKTKDQKQEKPKEMRKSQENKKIQQKDSIPKQKMPKIQQKFPVKSSTFNNVSNDNKKILIKKENIDLSSDQSELNKGHINIESQQSSKSKDNRTENFQDNEDSSDWDNSSNDSKEENNKIDKSSFECQQLQLQFPIPPLIPDNHHNLSDLNEDLSFLQQLGMTNNSNLQEKYFPQKISANQQKILNNRNENDSFSNNEGKLFSQEQLRILRKMFDLLPVDHQTVFIELKIITSNVASFKIKNISSEVFNLKDALTEEIKNHPFIKIKQFEKSVPRDFLPLLIKPTNNNQISDSKTSKLVLAQILCPLNLLEYREKFEEKQQKIILKKIEKNKKIFEDVNELITVDEITLRCSSCNNKKSFLWNNNLMPHQCKSNCPNFLRFSIEGIYIC